MKEKKLKKKLVLKKSIRNFLSRILLTIIIFLLALIVIKKTPNLKNELKTTIYESSFKFTKFKNLYQKYFGNILSVEKLIQEDQPVFTEKLNYEKATKYKDGVKLTVSNNYMVPIIESGVVVFIGNKEEYGPTIVVEQVNNVTTSYSNVEASNIKLYDYVEKGKLLGQVKSTNLFLVFQKDGEFLDYKKYL